MLPKAHRLRRSAEFRHVIRRGQRVSTSSLVLHSLSSSLDDGLGNGLGSDDEQPVRVGLVVGRAVGNAVTRNTVKRRLRHLMAARLDALPQTTTLVVRANPSAATAGWEGLGRDLDNCLRRLDRGQTPRKQRATPVTA